MSTFSSVPIIGIVLGLFWVFLSSRSIYLKNLSWQEGMSVFIWLFLICVWAVISSQLAISGFYVSSESLALMPMLWVPLIPIIITGALLILVKPFRKAVYILMIDHARKFVLIHALRIAAIGGISKAFAGALPIVFVLGIGIPDLLFGLSALIFATIYLRHEWNPRTLVIWNMIGFAVILPAPLLGQMSIPGPLYTFTSLPDVRALLEYPLVLAPTVIVPLFMTMNGLQAIVNSSLRKYFF